MVDLAEAARMLRTVVESIGRGELDASPGLARRVESAAVTLNTLADSLEKPTSAT
jgi:hypothetical protein